MRKLLLMSVVIVGSIPVASAQSWSSWRPDATYHGIEVRMRCTGFNEFAGRYLWDVQLRNRYQKNVDLAWAAEPQKLHGADVQGDRALAVLPGEVVDAHHTAPVDCSSGLMVRVSEVRDAANPSSTTVQASSQQRPQIQGHWTSHDPEPLQKSFTVQVFSDTVTGQWSSPGFSLDITTPLPKNIHGSVSLDASAPKDAPAPK
jgi:hypothetical protein